MASRLLKNFIPLFSLAFFLSGCVATTQGYRQVLDTWIGSTEQSLIQSWGPPDRVYENNGVRILTYDNQKTSSLTLPQYQTTTHQGSVYGDVSGSYYGTSGTWVNQTHTTHHRCKTNFTVSPNGTISSYTFEGNSCRSVESSSGQIEEGDPIFLEIERERSSQNPERQISYANSKNNYWSAVSKTFDAGQNDKATHDAYSDLYKCYLTESIRVLTEAGSLAHLPIRNRVSKFEDLNNSALDICWKNSLGNAHRKALSAYFKKEKIEVDDDFFDRFFSEIEKPTYFWNALCDAKWIDPKECNNGYDAERIEELIQEWEKSEEANR